ncbi:MAG: cysteine hydrolase, partial [Clostridia bacterium]|nr:cysteine hydrolase [Clostridia bacterium]
EIEGAVAEKIDEYHKRGDDVLFTLDSHGENYAETYEGKNLPVAHCIIGTEGHRLYGKVRERREASDKLFPKKTFGSKELYDYFKENEYESIELAGVVTNICVMANAVLAKTAQPEKDIIVDARCVASNDAELNEAALKVMESMQIKVMR